MAIPSWQPVKPIDAIFFDCDGTLSSIEGIDELAKINQVGDTVKVITAEAMGTTGLNPTLYQERLNLVRPSKEQVLALGLYYFTHKTLHIDNVIQIFKRLDKSIYLISAGLRPAVSIFGELLQIDPNNIYGVDIQFHEDGSYLDFDHTSELVQNNGKKVTIKNLCKQYAQTGYVGDGLNDLIVRDLVSRFVGYGGIFFRPNIAEHCQYYISTPSIAALLPLFLTNEETHGLTKDEKILYHKGLNDINKNNVLIR